MTAARLVSLAASVAVVVAAVVGVRYALGGINDVTAWIQAGS